ncbi:hypothetical protein [Vibrio sp. 10N]|uniref:hypothetical protein n=1 Tax=Vibrio sp. 10N TaxID=3058938 RepID=UPI0030C71D4E
MKRTKITFTLFLSLLLTVAGCATHNEFASEAELHHHNQQARNFCKQLNEGEQYYQCFDRYLLKSSSVTMHKLITTQRSLQRAMETQAS